MTDVQAADDLRVFLVRPAHLRDVRSAVAEGNPQFAAADELLLAQADTALGEGPFSVLDKDRTAPGGDPHDYVSQAPYWWPNADTEDGMPYVRRDGEVNPDSTQLDREPLGRLCAAVATLALAYYLSDYEPFADHAALLLRTWFLDESTRMNPHLDFAQGIPGRCTGRGIGIIDTVRLTRVIDALGMLASASTWTRDDRQGMQSWFAAYLDWLLSSSHGRDEQRQPNNHGTWYDVQVACMALFTGREEIARTVLRSGAVERIASQVEPDGRQPLELRRTKALSYSVMNLLGLFDLAELGTRVGVDLWHWRSRDGRCLHAAVEWLVAHGLDGSEWPYQQLGNFDRRDWIPLLRRGAVGLDMPRFEQRLQALGDELGAGDRGYAAHRTHLLYPSPLWLTNAAGPSETPRSPLAGSGTGDCAQGSC